MSSRGFIPTSRSSGSFSRRPRSGRTGRAPRNVARMDVFRSRKNQESDSSDIEERFTKSMSVTSSDRGPRPTRPRIEHQEKTRRNMQAKEIVSKNLKCVEDYFKEDEISDFYVNQPQSVELEVIDGLSIANVAYIQEPISRDPAFQTSAVLHEMGKLEIGERWSYHHQERHRVLDDEIHRVKATNLPLGKYASTSLASRASILSEGVEIKQKRMMRENLILPAIYHQNEVKLGVYLSIVPDFRLWVYLVMKYDKLRTEDVIDSVVDRVRTIIPQLPEIVDSVDYQELPRVLSKLPLNMKDKPNVAFIATQLGVNTPENPGLAEPILGYSDLEQCGFIENYLLTNRKEDLIHVKNMIDVICCAQDEATVIVPMNLKNLAESFSDSHLVDRPRFATSYNRMTCLPRWKEPNGTANIVAALEKRYHGTNINTAAYNFLGYGARSHGIAFEAPQQMLMERALQRLGG